MRASLRACMPVSRGTAGRRGGGGGGVMPFRTLTGLEFRNISLLQTCGAKTKREVASTGDTSPTAELLGGVNRAQKVPLVKPISISVSIFT